MNSRSVFIVLAALLAVSSCALKQREGGTSYVREIIQDKESRANRLVAASATPDPQGDIIMIGSERECAVLADIFASIDVRDNVDGSFNPDGLPDFAGETISCIIDTTGRPETYLHAHDASDNRSRGFRKFLVDGFINALDTVCHVTPYDLEGIGHKMPAKIIISADPFLSQYARHDVDTLFNALGSGVHVISPYFDIEEAVLNSQEGRDDAVVAVLHSRESAGVPAYKEHFMKHELSFTARDSVSNQFTALLDDYIAAGNTKPVNVLAVADLNADVQTLKSEYAALLSVLNEDSARYSQYLAKNFRIVGGVQPTVARCYDLLRADNLFSHRISKPQILVYYCHPDPQDSDVSFLVPAPYVQN